MKIGFTGNRNGCTKAQLDRLRIRLRCMVHDRDSSTDGRWCDFVDVDLSRGVVMGPQTLEAWILDRFGTSVLSHSFEALFAVFSYQAVLSEEQIERGLRNLEGLGLFRSESEEGRVYYCRDPL